MKDDRKHTVKHPVPDDVPELETFYVLGPGYYGRTNLVLTGPHASRGAAMRHARQRHLARAYWPKKEGAKS